MVSADALDLDDYKYFRRRIEAGFETRQKRLDAERRQAIQALNENWAKMGGSAEDVGRFERHYEASSQGESSFTHRPEDEALTRNGSARPKVSMKEVRQVTQDVLDDERIEAITQTIIKDRILAEHPNAELQPLRVKISRLLRELVNENMLILEEAGTGGAPNRYRRNEEVEVERLY